MKSRNVARNDFTGGGGRDLVSMRVDDARKLVQAFRGNDWGGDIFLF